jgi:hypothetical protein
MGGSREGPAVREREAPPIPRFHAICNGGLGGAVHGNGSQGRRGFGRRKRRSAPRLGSRGAEEASPNGVQKEAVLKLEQTEVPGSQIR